MNIEISDILLSRTNAVARIYNRKVENLVEEIYRIGLEHVELGSISLSDEQKNSIRSRPECSACILAHELGTRPLYVRRYRLELAAKYLQNGFSLTESDIDVSKRFGLKVYDFISLRLRYNFKRDESTNWNRPRTLPRFVLGTEEEIRVALTEGGQTISGLIRKQNLNISRERARQIVAEYGLTGDSSQRKPIWYAMRLCGQDKKSLAQNLVNDDWVREQLVSAGGTSGLASRLGIGVAPLQKFISARLGKGCLNLTRCHGTMVELKCSYCNGRIFRLKSKVERDKRLYPNRTTFYCKKICQGKALGERC